MLLSVDEGKGAFLASYMGFPGALVIRTLPADAGNTRDSDLIPGSGRSPGGVHGNPCSILAWEIPWTEEAGGLHSMGSQRVRTTETA